MCKYRTGEEQGEIRVRAAGKTDSLCPSDAQMPTPIAKKLWEMLYLEMVVEISAEQMNPPGQIL